MVNVRWENQRQTVPLCPRQRLEGGQTPFTSVLLQWAEPEFSAPEPGAGSRRAPGLQAHFSKELFASRTAEPPAGGGSAPAASRPHQHPHQM